MMPRHSVPDDDEAGPPGDDDDEEDEDEDEEDGSDGDEVGLSYLMKEGIQVSHEQRTGLTRSEPSHRPAASSSQDEEDDGDYVEEEEDEEEEEEDGGLCFRKGRSIFRLNVLF